MLHLNELSLVLSESSFQKLSDETKPVFIADIAILTLTKYLQNLLRDSTLSVISAAKEFLFKVVLIMLKMPSETFL